MIVRNTVYATAGLIVAMLFFAEDNPITIIPTAAGYASVIWMLYRHWARTRICIGENDIVIRRDTVFVAERTIPYNRIAAVNADRGIINRMFGTVRLKVNVNTSVNAFTSEATLTFRREEAEEIYAELSEKIFGKARDERSRDPEGPKIPFTRKGIILHGLFGISSYQTLTMLTLLTYYIIGSMYSERDPISALIALAIAAAMNIVPLLFTVIKYVNFKISRAGDVIYIQHGSLRKYRSSFHISKMNAVRTRSTFFTRIMKRAYIEAEVVGMDGSYGRRSKIRPMLCPLSRVSVLQEFMEATIPEFIYPHSPKGQPLRAAIPLTLKAAAISAIFIGAAAFIAMMALEALEELGLGEEFGPEITSAAVLAAMIAVAVSVIWIILSTITKRFDAGDEMFLFKNGVLDHETVIMYYDKAQTVRISSGPVTRMLGLARCEVAMLATAGKRVTASGFFFERDLSVIMDRVRRRFTKKAQ